jgi:hypothetical protein
MKCSLREMIFFNNMNSVSPQLPEFFLCMQSSFILNFSGVLIRIEHLPFFSVPRFELRFKTAIEEGRIIARENTKVISCSFVRIISMVLLVGTTGTSSTYQIVTLQLQITHEVFFLHSLIPSLPFLLSHLQLPTLYSIQFSF